MFSRRETIVLGILFVAFLVLSFALGPVQAANNPLDPRLTTLRTSPNGARAAYLTLEELGIPVGRAERSFAVAGLPDGALAILAPRRTIIPEEIGRLMEWIREGGQLLYIPLPTKRASPGTEILDSLGLRAVFQSDDPPSSIPRAHRWTEGIDSFPPSAWALSSEIVDGASQPVPVITSDSLSVVVEAAIGDGRVIVWMDGGWLRNAGLKTAAEPAILLARIAAELTSAGDTLYFDEYHHGFQEGGGPIRTMLRFFRSTPMGRSTFHLAAIGLLAMVFGGIRFGAPHPPPRKSRRSPMEHVQALGQAYRGARAESRLARLFLIGLARHLKHRSPPEDAQDTAHWIHALPVPTLARARLVDAWETAPGPRLATLADAIDLTLSEGKRM